MLRTVYVLSGLGAVILYFYFINHLLYPHSLDVVAQFPYTNRDVTASCPAVEVVCITRCLFLSHVNKRPFHRAPYCRTCPLYQKLFTARGAAMGAVLAQRIDLEKGNFSSDGFLSETKMLAAVCEHSLMRIILKNGAFVLLNKSKANIFFEPLFWMIYKPVMCCCCRKLPLL